MMDNSSKNTEEKEQDMTNKEWKSLSSFRARFKIQWKERHSEIFRN